MNRLKQILILLFGIAILLPELSHAQQFGRNKPRYRSFDFKVYETPNFEIYHYLDDYEALNTIAKQSEIWYDHIQKFTNDTIKFKNPIIMFNSHGDFQQTNTINSTVSVATGGVTEAFKNRVTMPFTMSNQKTFQILGHELVHAFQYNVVLRGDSTSIQNLANLPLFMVEGMAEYLTRGRKDPFTAMWMRDIVLQDEIPELKEMANPKYFPYRYGQAFWAVMTGIYGDGVIAPFFQETAKVGMEQASLRVFGTGLANISSQWQNAIKNYYTGIMGADAKERSYGRLLLDDDNAGFINISPSISPDGRYLIFLSEKGLFTTDLYLADTRSGKIIRKIASTLKDGDIDNLNAFESSGTWSPKSDKFLYVAFSKGKNKIIIKDVSNAKQTDEFFIDGVEEIANPIWSPDGRSIVFSGLNQGQGDLYQYDLRSKRLRRLTNDVHSEIMPDFSKDGSLLVFATDRLSQDDRPLVGEWKYNIAVMDLVSGAITNYPFFPGADNLNPNFDENGDIWFLSNRDGFRNIYKYEVLTDSLFQMTDFLTGVSGITPYSPALTVSKRRKQIIYNHYFDGKYRIYNARERLLLRKPVDPNDVDMRAGTLPVVGARRDVVTDDIQELDELPAPDIMRFEEKEYKSRMQLDFINGGVGVGVGVGGGPFGSGLVNNSGVTALFSDMLGDKQIIASLGLNGEIVDAAGIFQFINRKNRFNWGFIVGHVPQRSAFFPQPRIIADELNLNGQNVPVFVDRIDIVRIFQDQVGVLGAWPFSTTLRLEGNVSSTFQYFRIDRYEDFYFQNGNFLGPYVGTQRRRISTDDASYQNFNLESVFVHNAGVALVGDNSYFGLTSPLAGHRFRVGINKYFGGFDYESITVDGRKYFWLQPISLGFRVLHFARTGEDANNFFPIFVGQQGLVRGYNFSESSNALVNDYNLSIDQLLGSKIFVANFEARLPFTGPRRLALIQSGLLLSDLNFFVDGGVAFNEYGNINFNLQDPAQFDQSAVVFSTGVSLRVNLFGLIVEPFYAFPLREGADPGFGFNFLFGGF